ncbi:hypothetical protein HNV10_04895 [Winogradskyella litoriviva]|uniref:Outer membrane protein beta-barrel domain-containing protein n=1 Tax=Winogradskyella litoriviva TaxID=1220182 RepID=A0ABX2E3M8_9FLAO|nr:hypothetical protein [Winogradskyella litoriviva]NRD22566.1 hypothetical protein [Winogradskyella litoriviva]
MKTTNNHDFIFMTTLILYLLTSIFCYAQQSSQFKLLQEDFASHNWGLQVNGIFLSENVSLTAGQHEFKNFEISLIEVPILFKIKVTDKLSILSGVKLDFYKTKTGLSKEVGASVSTGLQYDFNNDLYLKGSFNYQINQTNNIYNYNFGSPSSFMLKSGFRF